MKRGKPQDFSFLRLINKDVTSCEKIYAPSKPDIGSACGVRAGLLLGTSPSGLTCLDALQPDKAKISTQSGNLPRTNKLPLFV